MPIEVLVVGAGPFGLSMSAHLHDQQVEHEVVGRVVDTWENHMPRGMMLRSEPYGSDMSAPGGTHFDVKAYSMAHGLDYVDRLGPLSLARWLDYSHWFANRLAPNVRSANVASIARSADGYRIDFTDSGSICARQVVLATGVLPYRTLPEQLSGFSSDLVTHTSDHRDLSRFRGQKVAVLGSGQSATETAALLHESGAETTMVIRAGGVNWLEPNPASIRGIGHVRRPVNKLCEGWHCAFWNTPLAFRRLPKSVRVDKARSVLGPAGAWWLKDRVQGVVDIITHSAVTSAVQVHDRLRLNLTGCRTTTGPGPAQLDVDHVIAGTGFRVDLAKLNFLAADLRDSIQTLGGYPVLSRGCESSVPGLYFVGAPAAVSLGPSVRFIAGTHTSVPQATLAVKKYAMAAATR